jgi:hypothetical protein
MKKASVLIIIAVLFCCFSLNVYAHDVPEERNDCSIEVSVHYGEVAVSGGTLTAVKIGYVDEDDGNYFFSRIGDDALLEDVESTEAIDALMSYYEENKTQHEFEAKTVSVAEGKAMFENLSTGLYLVFQEEAAAGYTKMNAFLVGLPYMENDDYIYHVDASMKPELKREPQVVPPPTPPDPDIPQTGQLNWPIPVLVCSGLILVAFGLLLRCKNGKKTNEK